MITSLYLNRKKKKIGRSSSQWVRRYNFLHKIFYEKILKDQDSLKFTGGLDKGGLDSVEYGILEFLKQFLSENYFEIYWLFYSNSKINYQISCY